MHADDPETLASRLPAALAAAQASRLVVERWSPPLGVLSSADHTSDPRTHFSERKGQHMPVDDPDTLALRPSAASAAVRAS